MCPLLHSSRSKKGDAQVKFCEIVISFYLCNCRLHFQWSRPYMSRCNHHHLLCILHVLHSQSAFHKLKKKNHFKATIKKNVLLTSTKSTATRGNSLFSGPPSSLRAIYQFIITWIALRRDWYSKVIAWQNFLQQSRYDYYICNITNDCLQIWRSVLKYKRHFPF